jgi:hypothetical protein
MSILRSRLPKQQKLATPAPGPKKAYQTTASAGWFVARQRIPGAYGVDAGGKTTHTPVVGSVIWLTDQAAQYPLRQGEITPMSPQPKSNSAADVQAAIAAQAAATAAPAPTSAAAPASAASASSAPSSASATASSSGKSGS